MARVLAFVAALGLVAVNVDVTQAAPLAERAHHQTVALLLTGIPLFAVGGAEMRRAQRAVLKSPLPSTA
jgi:hypothetical protein